MPRKTSACFVFAALLLAALSKSATAQDLHCDPAWENCRTPLIKLIRAETRGIDVAQWFIKDYQVVDELIKRHQAGVPVRFIVDRRGDAVHEGSMEMITKMATAGIPMREKRSGGIVHWKMFIFAGQHIVKFGAANLTGVDYVPVDPFTHYRNETHIILKGAEVDSFMTKFEDRWLSTSLVDYANMTPELKLRKYPITPIDTAHLGFGPEDPFSTRLVAMIDRETVAIDVSLMRLGKSSLTDALIRAKRRGVKVRVNSEQTEYRDTKRYLHAHALDKLYMNGIQIRWRNHNGQNHEKTMLLHGQGIMWTGSSNWVSSSDQGGNMEHNYFTDPTQTDWFQYYSDRFERRWGNLQYVNGVRMLESKAFVPLPPGKAAYKSPANGFVGTPTALVINGGFYGFYADVYLGTSSTNLTLYKANVPLSVNKNISVPLPALTPGKTYYWRVNNKTFANKVSIGYVYSFRVP
jgi:phosphatidylserine/phosphatidylglycerophosphate/cardiolipin synthase-like enzyme